MEPNQTPQNIQSTVQSKSSLKDIFLNLGGFVALYTVLYSLINLLFTVINFAYPQVTQYNNYYSGSSASISFPVATLVIFFPIFVYLMWLIQRDLTAMPEKRNNKLHKWLTYITLFISGLTLAGDLVTVVYYFIDGQELTSGFLLKFLTLFIIALCLFIYFISDIRGKLTPSAEKLWIALATVITLGSIIWGFAVLGSPRTQRLVKYDQQKVADLQNLSSAVTSYYYSLNVLPENVADLVNKNYYYNPVDQQTQKPYEYHKLNNTTYEVCADFNRANPMSEGDPGILYRPDVGNVGWRHTSGHYCFSQTVTPDRGYKNGVPIPIPMM